MNVSSIVKKGAPSVEPHELTVISDPTDPLYDHRLHLPIKDEAVLNLAAAGQVQPIAVRARGFDEMVIVDGLQRWKRATVINHLVGRRAYEGEVACILEAIERLKNSTIGRRVVELAGGGMKLYISVYRGADKEALRAKGSANVWREDDGKAEQIRKAQQMSRHGFSNAEIAETLGKTETTVERYLAADPDKPITRKKRGKSKRPGTKRLGQLAELLTDPAPNLAVVLGWASGTRTEAEVVEAWPQLAPALKAAKKRKAA